MRDLGHTAKTENYFANARAERLPFVPAQARTLLEVGCGGADFAALLKSQRTIHVTAIEAFPAAAKQPQLAWTGCWPGAWKTRCASSQASGSIAS